MKNTIRNRFIITFAIFIFIMSVMPIDTLTAAPITNHITFETWPVTNANFNDGFLGAYSYSGWSSSIVLNATTVSPRSGSRSLAVNGGPGTGGWLNLTYADFAYMTSYDFWIRMPNYVGGYAVLGLMNFTNYYYQVGGYYSALAYFYEGSTHSSYFEHIDILMRFNMTHSYWRQYGSQEHVFATGGVANVYRHVYVNVTSSTGEVSYHVSGLNTTHSYANNVTQIILNKRLDRMGVRSVTSVYCTRLDDCNFTLSDRYPLGTGNHCGINLSTYTGIGDSNAQYAQSVQVNGEYISSNYGLTVNSQITAVEIGVSAIQYADDPNLGNYTAWINGDSIGNPDCFYQDSADYIMMWSCAKSVTNAPVVFDFYHSKSTNGRYWQILATDYQTDIDNDGDTEFKWSEYQFLEKHEWVWLPPHWQDTYSYWSVSGGYNGRHTENRDLYLRWYCTGLAPTETYDFTDTLGLSGYEYANATGYIYHAWGNGIQCAYTLGNPALSYTLTLYHNNTKIYQNGFPKTLVYPGGSCGFTPMQPGKYRFQMNTTHVVKNVTAWVLANPNEFAIISNPSVTDQFSSYTVSVKYYHPTAAIGYIVMFTDHLHVGVINTNVYADADFTQQITGNNRTLNFTYNSQSDRNEYWRVFTYNNLVYTPVCQHHIHFIRIPSLLSNSISTGRTLVEILHNNPNHNSNTIYYQHIFPGSDVWVTMNGIKVKNVGENQNSYFEYVPMRDGTFNASLVLYSNNSYTILASTSFNVRYTDNDTVKPGEFDSITDLIPNEYKLYIAIVFIIFMVMLPTIIIFSLQKKLPSVKVEIPEMIMTITSIFSGFLGFVLTIIWGLLDWVWFFAFTFTLIVILALMYYSGHRSGGGGNATQ